MPPDAEGLMLNCLGGKITGIAKGNPVFLEGDPAEFVGVVLSGKVQIVRTDYYGNRSVLTVVSPGATELFPVQKKRNRCGAIWQAKQLIKFWSRIKI